MRKLARPRQISRKTTELTVLPERIRQQIGSDLPLPIPRREVDRVERGGFEYEEIAQWIGHFLETEPGHPQAGEYDALRKQLADLHELTDMVRDGRVADARPGLERILASNPRHIAARINLGDCYNVAGEHDKALATAEQLAAELPSNLRVLLIRARALDALKRRPEAAALLRAAFASAPGQQAIRRELVRIGELIPVAFDAGQGQSPRFIDRSVYEKAALQQIDKIASDKPASWDAAFGIVERLRTMGLYDAAVRAAETLQQPSGDDPRAATEAGLALLALGRLDEAEARLRKALEKNPTSAPTLLALGRTLLVAKKKEDSEKVLEGLLASNPNNIEAAELLVLACEGDDAQVARAAALHKKHPDSWAIVKLIGDLDFRLGDIEDALKRHMEAWEKSESDDALAMILHDLDRLDRTDEAVKMVDAVKGLHARSSTARWNAANIYLKSGRVRPAMVIIEQMVRDNNLIPGIRHQAAELLAEIRSGGEGRY